MYAYTGVHWDPKKITFGIRFQSSGSTQTLLAVGTVQWESLATEALGVL